MAKENATATGEIDYDKLGAAVAKALASTIAEAVEPIAKNQKIIADTMTAQAAATKAPEAKQDNAAAGEKPLTRAELLATLEERDKGRQTAQQKTAEREKFLGEKMKDLPPAYRNQLGDDSSKWTAEEQAIRQQYQADFKASGGKAPEISGAANGASGGAAPAAAIDMSKMSAIEKIKLGLKNDPVPLSGTQQHQTAADGAAK